MNSPRAITSCHMYHNLLYIWLLIRDALCLYLLSAEINSSDTTVWDGVMLLCLFQHASLLINGSVNKARHK